MSITRNTVIKLIDEVSTLIMQHTDEDPAAKKVAAKVRKSLKLDKESE